MYSFQYLLNNLSPSPSPIHVWELRLASRVNAGRTLQTPWAAGRPAGRRGCWTAPPSGRTRWLWSKTPTTYGIFWILAAIKLSFNLFFPSFRPPYQQHLHTYYKMSLLNNNTHILWCTLIYTYLNNGWPDLKDRQLLLCISVNYKRSLSVDSF